MESALTCFNKDCFYEDMQYPDTLCGRAAIRTHLESFAGVLPLSFCFVVDNLVVNNDENINNEMRTINWIAAQWHLKNNDKEMPFT